MSEFSKGEPYEDPAQYESERLPEASYDDIEDAIQSGSHDITSESEPKDTSETDDGLPHELVVAEPTEAFYNGDPEASEIRSVTLRAADAYDALLQGDPEAVGALMEANQRLRDLGIAEDMHTIDLGDPERDGKVRSLKSDPVAAAEFVAGQVIKIFTRDGAFSVPDASLFAEHNLLDNAAGPYAIFELEHTNPQIYDFLVRRGVIERARAMLDATNPEDSGR